jgi:hypothetical protein
MSDVPTNYLIDIDYIAAFLMDGLNGFVPNSITLDECREYVFLSVDDFIPSRLMWAEVTEEKSKAYLEDISKLRPTLKKAIDNRNFVDATDAKVLELLSDVCAYKTWSYIFVHRLGGNIRIEITGDHRIDEWQILTNGGTLSISEAIDSFGAALENRLLNAGQGIEVSFDLKELAREIVLDQSSIVKRLNEHRRKR